MRGKILSITHAVAKDFLLDKHYSGRTPSITYAYGLYENNDIVAVCTFGKPASCHLCDGVCGREYSDKVFELNRLCRIDEYKEQLSAFVGGCLRRLRPDNIIVVSYSDTGMSHHGYIYQATNFIYTGVTVERTDKYTEGNKHSRHYSDEKSHLRKVRTPKHRYIYFCTQSKKTRKVYREALKYPVEEYPKGVNSNYKLGEYQKVKIINNESGEVSHYSPPSIPQQTSMSFEYEG